MNDKLTSSPPLLEYRSPDTRTPRRVLRIYLTRIAVAMVLVSFGVGATGGFYGNFGSPGPVRVYGAMGILLGAVLYVIVRVWQEPSGTFMRLQLAFTAAACVIAVSLAVPFRMPSVFADSPWMIFTDEGLRATRRYTLRDKCIFDLSLVSLVMITLTGLGWYCMSRLFERNPARLR